MPRLTNTRHELFAQHLAAGKSASEAFVLAGYSKNDGNAIRLKGNEKVAARVAERQKKLSDDMEITKKSLSDLLLRGVEKALEIGQMSAYGQLVERLGRLNGFAFDPIKEGSSIPLGQIAPEPVQPASENVVDFRAVAAKYGWKV